MFMLQNEIWYFEAYANNDTTMWHDLYSILTFLHNKHIKAQYPEKKYAHMTCKKASPLEICQFQIH